MIKRYVKQIVLTMFMLSISHISIAVESTPLALLQKMQRVIYSSNYQLNFINVTRSNIDSLRYQQAIIDNTVLAQLLQMDGSARKIIMRANEISYYIDKNNDPFTIQGDHIIDAMPAIVFVNFVELQQYYDYLLVGQARIADRECDIIRIIAKENNRYSYLVWIDRSNFLPLQIELLAPDNQTMEQFRVITFSFNNNLKQNLNHLLTLKLPPKLVNKNKQYQSIKFNWQVNWLPDGFRQITANRQRLEHISDQVESALFSDGLFTISINVMETEQKGAAKFAYQGVKTFFNEVKQGYEIVIIGDIPQNTAKNIANSITFSTQN